MCQFELGFCYLQSKELGQIHSLTGESVDRGNICMARDDASNGETSEGVIMGA